MNGVAWGPENTGPLRGWFTTWRVAVDPAEVTVMSLGPSGRPDTRPSEVNGDDPVTWNAGLWPRPPASTSNSVEESAPFGVDHHPHQHVPARHVVGRRWTGW